MPEEIVNPEGGQPLETPNTGNVENPNPAVETKTEPTFKVPEAYKEKGWAKNIKSEEDFWKSLDNAQSAMGKKYLAPDLANMTDKERDAYYASVRPKEASEYAFPAEATDGEKQIFGELLHGLGVTKYQGDKLMEKFIEKTKGVREEAFSPEGLEKVLKTSFGDEYQVRTKELGNLLKSHVSKEDWQLFDKELPNNVQGLVFRVLDKFQKAYGAKEGTATPPNNGGSSFNVEESIKAVNNEIIALSKNPLHTQKDKDILLKKLGELYKQKGNMK